MGFAIFCGIVGLIMSISLILTTDARKYGFMLVMMLTGFSIGLGCAMSFWTAQNISWIEYLHLLGLFLTGLLFFILGSGGITAEAIIDELKKREGSK